MVLVYLLNKSSLAERTFNPSNPFATSDWKFTIVNKFVVLISSEVRKIFIGAFSVKK